MTLPEGIAISTFVFGTMGFFWKIQQDVKEIKKQVTNDLQHISEEEDTKRARIYERLDENKQDSEKKYVMREVCNKVHEQSDKKIDEMASDIKILLGRQCQ